jgi:hypothetical protein
MDDELKVLLGLLLIAFIAIVLLVKKLKIDFGHQRVLSF